MSASTSKAQWIRMGSIPVIKFVGRDSVCWGEGCHLIFTNLLTNETSIYTANSNSSGDGIQTYTGHRTLGAFGFTEGCVNPAIHILEYPSFQPICTFREPSSPGYIAIVFSDTSLACTLSDMPQYMLTIWNWRSGSKVSSFNSTILSPRQMLRGSIGSPLYLAQLGVNSKKLQIWDVLMVKTTAVVIEHEIIIPSSLECQSYVGILWIPEGALFVLDKNANVFMMNDEYELEPIIMYEGSGSHNTSFCWHKNGITVAGPNYEIRHYKKFGTWSVDWSIEPPEPLHTIICSRSDILIGISIASNILILSQNKENITKISEVSGLFIDMCLVYPSGKYVAVLTVTSVLIVYDIATGILTATSTFANKALSIASNPVYPYIGIGFENGTLELWSKLDDQALCKMLTFNLCTNPITSIYFVHKGKYFVAANKTVGHFFVIDGIPGGYMKVVSIVEMNQQIADFMMVSSRSCHRLFVLPVTSKTLIASNKLVRYCITDEVCNVKEYKFSDPNVMYTKLVSTIHPDRDRCFHAIPCYSKRIHTIEIKRGDSVAVVSPKTIPTGHQLRKFELSIDKYNAITWAVDGFVIVRSPNFTQQKGIALPHHRYDYGVKKALVVPNCQYIISLGYENMMICSKLEQTFNVDVESIDSPPFASHFDRKTIVAIPKGINKDTTWVEIFKIQQSLKEQKQCRDERQELIDELASIRTDLQMLLTDNLNGPENERLDMLEFNLNKNLYEEKVAANEDLCIATENYLRNVIKVQDGITTWIQKTIWTKCDVQRTKIYAIFETFDVENYVTLQLDLEHKALTLCTEEQRKLEKHFNLSYFEAWKLFDGNALAELMKADIHQTVKEKSIDIMTIGMDEEASIVKDEFDEFLLGSSTHKFIETNQQLYHPMQVTTAIQHDYQTRLLKHEIEKLKIHFNKLFNDVMEQKKRDMQVIQSKNARLRHIISEINYFSTEKIDFPITDPDWKLEENPESINCVKDNEISVLPYTSPSEQLILDAKAAEEERLRLLMLADDFKERALMKMMNGVLEIRWEDELKKEVPKPKCMLEKEPEHYNEEDLRSIKVYEDQVKTLNSDREKYKTMLRSEFHKIIVFVNETVTKFNRKLRDLLILKMQIQCAIDQENLKINRINLHHQHRELLKCEEQAIIKRIAQNEGQIEHLPRLIGSLTVPFQQCREAVDALHPKEKVLERSFKREIQDASPIVQEQLLKLYRKRPKATFKNINSATLLELLANCVIKKERPRTLTADCLEFLKSLDSLDSYTGVSQTVDPERYVMVCRHRRQRIEFEIRVKAAYAHLTHSESTVAVLQKTFTKKKDYNHKLIEDLAKQRDTMIKFIQNAEVQLSLPRGLVELKLEGTQIEFTDAYLICRNIVEHVNEIILTTGKEKITLMHQTMNYRKAISLMEWQHKKIKMQIEDLKEHINDINNVRVTKEMNTYLRKGTVTDVPFDIELATVTSSFEKMLKERIDTVRKMNKQIQTIQKETKLLDNKISSINLDVCEFQMLRDVEMERREKTILQSRMNMLLRRSQMVADIQKNHNTILILQTELELLKLKTYPTISHACPHAIFPSSLK